MKSNQRQDVVLRFNNCINNSDIGGLGDLMTDDHDFIDSGNNTLHGKEEVLKAWEGFLNYSQIIVTRLKRETNAFWRYQKLGDRISEHNDLFTPNDLKSNNACVNIMKLFEEMGVDPAHGSIAANVQSRTLWHSLYDQQAGTAEFSFYLSDTVGADGTRTDHRSDYLTFKL